MSEQQPAAETSHADHPLCPFELYAEVARGRAVPREERLELPHDAAAKREVADDAVPRYEAYALVAGVDVTHVHVSPFLHDVGVHPCRLPGEVAHHVQDV